MRAAGTSLLARARTAVLRCVPAARHPPGTASLAPLLRLLWRRFFRTLGCAHFSLFFLFYSGYQDPNVGLWLAGARGNSKKSSKERERKNTHRERALSSVPVRRCHRTTLRDTCMGVVRTSAPVYPALLLFRSFLPFAPRLG